VDSQRAKRLLVEGVDDVYAIAQLMGQYVSWTPPPVNIVACNGDEIFSPGRISLELKSGSVVGVMIDADVDGLTRWRRIRSEALLLYPEMAMDLPSEGLVISNNGGDRFGVWLMPDNRQEGMIETFLRWLVPPDNKVLWKHAEDSTKAAKDHHQAKFRESHHDKAKIHAWLAWMDPPGLRFGEAIRARILDPKSTLALPFVSWFRRLYEL
jgi:hypothetical protein